MLDELIEDNLHSTVVLLKVYLKFPAVKGKVKFTFYCSSIKRMFCLTYLTQIFRNLHSTVVLLKGKLLLSKRQPLGKFTFYCSSIKSKDIVIHKCYPKPFTFYCSSIKRWGSNCSRSSFFLFTFYCSSIKRLFRRYIENTYNYLHSTVVLLKEYNQGDYTLY